MIIDYTLAPCKVCRANIKNDGIPKVYPMECATGGTYSAFFVKCEQCLRIGPVRENVLDAITAWNKENKVKERRKSLGKTKKTSSFVIFACGAKKMKGLNKRTIAKTLSEMTKENYPDYVVVGNVRETEKAIYSQCRKQHLPVAIVPADFERFSINAEYLRNAEALKFFKPSKILIVHLDPEEDTSLKSVFSWAKHNKVEIVKVPHLYRSKK